MAETSLFAQRARYSRDRLDEFRSRIAAYDPTLNEYGLVVYAAGSYGRLEAGPHSDMDLFFVYENEAPRPEVREQFEARLFSAIKAIAIEMGLPEFDNNGEYLATRTSTEVRLHLGSPEDDYHNHFTSRMLMILESEPILNDEGYGIVLESYLDSYMRDFTGHTNEFHFMMLYNDISRYWKTLTLNYEHRRNSGAGQVTGREFTEMELLNHKAKNFKLKFSRLTTCFTFVGALSAALGENQATVSEPRALALEISRLTPQERLARVARTVPDLEEAVDHILEDYEWFMGLTALPKVDLLAKFVSKSDKQEHFSRATNYGERIFALLTELDAHVVNANQRVIRYLAM